MRDYKLVLLLKTDLKKEEKGKLVDEIKSWIGKLSKEKTTEIGERKLSYPIKREKKADYVLLEFSVEALGEGLDNKLRIVDNILRHLLIRVK